MMRKLCSIKASLFDNIDYMMAYAPRFSVGLYTWEIFRDGISSHFLQMTMTCRPAFASPLLKIRNIYPKTYNIL